MIAKARRRAISVLINRLFLLPAGCSSRAASLWSREHMMRPRLVAKKGQSALMS